MNGRTLVLLVALLGLIAGSARADERLERLLARAEKEAPDEVQLCVIKQFGRLSGFFAKVREVEKVEGWQQVRARGEAAFAAWDEHKRDFAWRSEKFEVLWDIKDGTRLKLNEVSIGGIARKAEP
jgi:hypothetical protein